MGKSGEFKYYSKNDVEKFKFFQLPKELYLLQRYANLSNNACVLYAMLRDRLDLSVENGWVDEKGNIYFIFSRDSAAEMIRVSPRTIISVFKELVEVGLLNEIRISRTSPKRLYLGQIINDGITVERHAKFAPLTCKNYTSRPANFAPHDVQNLHPNDTDINKTDINDTDLNNIYISSTPYQEIVDMFNNICVQLPKVKIISDKRKKLIKTMFNSLEQNLDKVKELFQKASESDFLNGKNKDSWSCTFDWIINTNNMIKVLEGNYSNKPKQQVINRDAQQKNYNQGNKGNFNNFEQRTYDYDSLEKKLLGWE